MSRSRRVVVREGYIELQYNTSGETLTFDESRRTIEVKIHGPRFTLDAIEAGLKSDGKEPVVESRPVMCGLLCWIFSAHSIRTRDANPISVVGGWGLSFRGSFRRTARMVVVELEHIPDEDEDDDTLYDLIFVKR